MSGSGRIMLVGALLAAGAGVAVVHAQTVLGDPRDAGRIFASNCSACHKSPRGLAKSGQVAGFLRQHYTTGPEMSAAMAAYLVSAGAAPPEKKGAATADGATAQKTKGKKQEQLSAVQPEQGSDATNHRTLRGKQQPGKSGEEAPATPASTQPAAEAKQAAASPPLAAAPQLAPAPPEAAPMVLDIPMPPLPEGPPADLGQSAFSSSPLP